MPEEKQLNLTEQTIELITKSKKEIEKKQLSDGLERIVFFGFASLALVLLSFTNLITGFFLFIILFAIIGAMRGWAKELLVSFGVILSIAFNYIVRRYIPAVNSLPVFDISLFWIRSIITITVVLFSYQSIRANNTLSRKTRRFTFWCSNGRNKWISNNWLSLGLS